MLYICVCVCVCVCVYKSSPGKNAGVGCHVLLQGIFPTQGLNPVSCMAGKFFKV